MKPGGSAVWRSFATVEELREALAAWLEDFWRDGARALSLIGRGWQPSFSKRWHQILMSSSQ